MGALRLLLALPFLFPGAGAAAAGGGRLHPDSISRSFLAIRGARAELTLRFQSLSLLEVLPALDLDGDRALSAEELEAGRAAVADYLLARYRLRDPDLGALTGALEEVAVLREALDGPLDLQWLEARFGFQAGAPIGPLVIESRLFAEQNPWHRDLARVVWNDEAPVDHLFSRGSETWTFEPSDVRRPAVLELFLELGIRHILRGYDHLAFLLVLIVAARRFSSLVGVVTAFTVAHSFTLALAAVNPWGLLARIPGRFVEMAIALSIAYVACENLVVRRPRNPWGEAFAFGLLHGLGFAGFLGDAMAGEPLVVTALLGFNLGVEIGQLAFVVLVVGGLALLRPRRKGDAIFADEGPPPIAPAWFRTAASVVVAGLGFFWFVERTGWFG